MPVGVEQRDVDDRVGVALDVELDDIDPIGIRAQHRLEPPQHDLVVVHECDACTLRRACFRMTHLGLPTLESAKTLTFVVRQRVPPIRTVLLIPTVIPREPGVGIEPTTC